VNSRADVCRSNAIGCQCATQMAQREDVRDLFIRLAAHWNALAEQTDMLNAMERWHLTPVE